MKGRQEQPGRRHSCWGSENTWCIDEDNNDDDNGGVNDDYDGFRSY